MTQPLTDPSLPPDQTDPNFDGIFNYADLAGAIANVPEIARQPGMAAAVAQSPNATGTAQALVGSAQQVNAQQVAKRAQSDGLFGHLANAIGSLRTGVWDRIPGHEAVDQGVQAVAGAGKEVLHLANMPLGGVQHNYRFVRDVFAKHGVAAGTGELLAASVGGIAGGVAGFFGGAVAGAGVGAIPGAIYGAITGSEGALQIAGRVGPYQDSWQNTANGDAYRLHGYPVSLGRDAASAIGLKPSGNSTLQNIVQSIPIIGLWLGGSATGQNLYNTVSGTLDATADVGADPLLAVGKLNALSKARTVITSAKDFERIAVNPPARVARMFSDVAGSDAGQIIEHYPTLRPLAPQLAAAKTPDDVVQVFRDNLATADLLGTRGLPSYSVTRVPLRAIADSLRNATPQDITGLSPAELAAVLPGNLVKGAVETITRGLSNRTPFAMDPTTNELLTTGWDPSNPRAAGVLYKTLRVHQSAETARAITSRFAAETDPAAKFDIWKDAQAQTVALALARHGVTDPKIVERLTSDLTDHTGFGGGGRDSKYGYDAQGNPVDRIPAGPDGASAASPLWEPQAGKLYTLNWSTLNSVARGMGKYSKVYGAIEDAAYHHFMAPLFKPQALLTGGFALRNSGNELLTRVIGSDGLGILRAAVEKIAAKRGYKLLKTTPSLPDETDHLTAALAESTDPRRLLTDPQYADTATRLLLESDGHILPPAASAGHMSAMGYGGDDLSDLNDNVKRIIGQATGRGPGGERLDPTSYVDYTSANGGKFGHALSGALSVVARDPAGVVMAKAYRKALTAGKDQLGATAAGRDAGIDFLRNTERGKYQTALLDGARVPGLGTPDADPIVSMASRRMQAILGLVTGQDGQVNRKLLTGLAEHDTPVAGRTAGMLHPNLLPDKINAMPLETLPTKVAGMELKPVADIGAVQRLQNAGFSKLGGVINRLSREPIYVHHVNEEYGLAKSIPGLSDDEAWQLAKTRAAERMIPEIHNPLDRSQFALAARSWLPFFFAREQAYRRLVSAILQNPTGFRKVQLMGHAMKDAGWTSSDPRTGEQTFNYPFSGAIASALPAVLSQLGVPTATGIPGGFRGSIQGLAAGGEAPGTFLGVGWSPLVSIPLRALASLDPQAGALVDKAEGPIAASQPWWSELISNSIVRSALTAAAPGFAARAFTNSQIDALQYAIARGDTPPNPTLPNGEPDPAYSAWMDRFVTHTRIMFGLKALFGIGAPASPQLQQGSKALSSLAQSYIDKYGLQEGTQKLFADHPNMTSYQVFRSARTSGLPDTQKAVDWARANDQFIKTFGKAATFFAPQSKNTDPAAQAARNAEVGLGLRAQRTPQEYVNEVVLQTGWNEYEQGKAARDAAIAAHPGDNQFASDQQTNFRNWMQTDLARRNPAWFAAYSSLDANTDQQRNLIEQTRAILASKAYPKSSQTTASLLSGLLADYDQHIAALTALGGNSTLYASAAARDERTNFHNYLDQFTQQHPEATVIVNRLFKGA